MNKKGMKNLFVTLPVITIAFLGEIKSGLADYVAVRGGFVIAEARDTSGRHFGALSIGPLPAPVPPARDLRDGVALAGFAYGFDLEGATRIELEFSHRSTAAFSEQRPRPVGVSVFTLPPVPEISSYTVRSNTLLVNFIYDLPISTNVDIFAGVGMGVSRLEVEGKVGDVSVLNPVQSTEVNPAYSISAGTAWRLRDNITIEGRYSFLDAGRFTASCDIPNRAFCGSLAAADVRYQDFSFGVRFDF